jgi:hypothetical protein
MRRQALIALGRISGEIKDGLEEIRTDVAKRAKRVDRQVRKGVKKTVSRAKKTIKRSEQ